MTERLNLGAGLRNGQIVVLKRSAELGRELRFGHPEMADMYRRGTGLQRIAKKLEIESAYGVSASIAKNAVRKALKGHSGQLGICAYAGLMRKGELEERGREHRRMGAERAGSFTQINRRGIFSMTRREHLEAVSKGGMTSKSRQVGIHALSADRLRVLGRAGGLIGGKIAYRKKLGIHSFTEEQMRERRLKVAEATGHPLWTKGECDFLSVLQKSPQCQHPDSDCHRGKPNWSLIATVVNRRFHGGKPVRSSHGVFIMYSEMRRAHKFISSKY